MLYYLVFLMIMRVFSASFAFRSTPQLLLSIRFDKKFCGVGKLNLDEADV